MIRFVAIASIRRGAIEPFEPLEPEDQRMALARLEHDGIWELYSDRVVWRGKNPVIERSGAKLAGCERRPAVSQETLRTLRGQPMELLAERHANYRRRMGQTKRVG